MEGRMSELTTAAHSVYADVIMLGDALSRVRALSEPESLALHRAMLRSGVCAPADGSPRWAAKDDTLLRRLVKQGSPNRAIATRLNRTVPAVQNRIRKLKIGRAGLGRNGKTPCQG
jgi:hypothetical protein